MVRPYRVLINAFSIGLFFLLVTCDDIKKQQELCASSTKEAFELLKENIDQKDIATVKQLCEQPETYVDTVFGNLSNPKIELIPEKSDGAFGIKKVGSAELFYTRVFNSDTTTAIKAVLIEQRGNCYKITNIANVDTTKKK